MNKTRLVLALSFGLIVTAMWGTGKKASATGNSLVINEIMVSNVDEFISPAYNFDGWIELYNPTEQSVALAGLYLSDDAKNLKKWQIPVSVGSLKSKAFRVLWFDSNNIEPKNAPFKLDVDGGTVYVSNSEGKLLFSQDYPASMERVSYARTTDGGDTWGNTSMATPGASNNNSKFASRQLSAPVVDEPSQVFSGTKNVNVTIPPGCTLRYTTDGSLPTLTNGETSTTGQFTVLSRNTNYRFRLFSDTLLASPVTTRSYIYMNKNYPLPILSVVCDKRFVSDDSIGVMVRGKNGRPGNGQSSACNWNMDWERPVNFSYIDTENEMVLNQDVNLEMCGGWSRAWTPHSFKLKGSKELGGNKNLPYPFFEQKPYIRNRTIQVRNGGNDTKCRFKDPSLQYIVESSGLNLDCQSYQPVHEFINGSYIGVMNVREPNNKHYVYANYGWDEDEIEQFEMSPDSGYVQKCGTPDAFNELVDVLSEDAANSETYDEICRVLDIDNYVNYMAVQLYLGNWDWPQNNTKGFRYIDGGKFRFILYDLDGAFNANSPFSTFMDKEYYQFDQLYPRSLGRIFGQIRFVTLFRNLLQNEDFRRRFIDTYCLIGGSVYEASRSTEIIDELLHRVNPAMSINSGSATNTANEVKSNLNSRLNTATSALRNYWLFDLYDTPAQKATIKSDVDGAQLLINNLQVPTGKFNGNLFAPVTLKAVAPAGYAFQGWLSSNNIKTIISSGSQWSYYDQGSLDDEDWTAANYDTTKWKQGTAPLGYGKDGIKTTLSYGSSSNKRPTSYFRTTVTLENKPKTTDEFMLNFTVDDGIIVYVNGKEAGRYNMPSDGVSYSTFATSYAPGNPDTGSMKLKTSLFQQGVNTIAIELHNNSATSSDLYWDAEVTMAFTSDNLVYYSKEQEIEMPDGKVNLTASYRALTDQERKEQGISPVRINEVSASNSTLINEYGKKNDWVELYNTTNEAIDVEGMYLTDNTEKPTKYQISKDGTNVNTIIPAHGYLLIWCDKLATTSQALHAPFKISDDGGIMALTAADKTWSDTFCYDAHDGNSTAGRFPDGAGQVFTMNVPTIGKANIMTSYMTEVPQKDVVIDKVSTLIATTGNFRIRYGAQQLIVKGENSGGVQADIYTTDGRLISHADLMMTNGKCTFDITHLPAGFYVARATNEQGERVSCKFMK